MYKLVFTVVFCAAELIVFSQTIRKEFKDIIYAGADNKKLLLDLYLPESKTNPYLIVWVHGGAWHSGSKESLLLIS